MTDRTIDERMLALLDRIARKDQTALRELYDLSSARMYGLALRIVQTRELAEDVLQESYLNVWRIAPDYRPSLSPPMAWLGMIVRSRALDLLRRRSSERADHHDNLDDGLDEHVDANSPDPMDLADVSQQAAALMQCLSRLDLQHREVLSLAYLRDLSHSELAEQLKVPIGTIKTWIRRGLVQLRGCMARFA